MQPIWNKEKLKKHGNLDDKLQPPVCLLGVTVLAVGIDQAETEELRRTVTDGSTQNILYARDAAQLGTQHSDLADLLCGIARIPDVRRNMKNPYVEFIILSSD